MANNRVVSWRRKVDREQRCPPYHVMLGLFTRGHTLETRRLWLSRSPTALAIPNIRMFTVVCHQVLLTVTSRPVFRFAISTRLRQVRGKAVKEICCKFWPNENRIRIPVCLIGTETMAKVLEQIGMIKLTDRWKQARESDLNS